MPEPDFTLTPKERVAFLQKQIAQLQHYRERFRIRTYGVALATLLGAALGTLTWSTEDPSESIGGLLAYVTIGIVAGVAMYWLMMWYVQSTIKSAERDIETELLKVGAAQLQDTLEEDFVTRLVQINFKYLDRYYDQTQTQANKSFTLCALASIVGLVVIVTGITMMYRGLAEPAYVTTATGVLSEFVSAVFFYFYNKTISKMASYHNKLVVTQNISLALKIAEGLENDAKRDAHKLLIDRLSDQVNLHLTRSEPNE
ncbi:MAG: hypothetical protein L6R43_00605 [Planctomycetes bacterium]|nr:hypothetical protein [Planctomycetota bacterium]